MYTSIYLIYNSNNNSYIIILNIITIIINNIVIIMRNAIYIADFFVKLNCLVKAPNF